MLHQIYTLGNKHRQTIALFLILNILIVGFQTENTYGDPLHLNVIIGDSYLSQEAYEGFNLFLLERRNFIEYKVLNRTILITDLEGQIYLENEIGIIKDICAVPVEFVNSTTILYVDNNGANLWNLAVGKSVELGPVGHHEVEFNYGNNSYFTLQAYHTDEGELTSVYERIVEYSFAGEEIWSVDTHDFVNISHWCPYEDMSGDRRDVTHSNTIFYDEPNDIIYLNCRNTNTFYKIDHKTGELVWSLGEFGDFSLYDIDGNMKDSLFYHAHALEMIEENKFVIFDNDLHNKTNANNLRSRLVEITVDYDKMIANISREWISPTDYYSGIWGDCDLLPNGNFLGVFGTLSHPDSEYGARLVEVNKDNDIVWEHSFPQQGQESYAVYRMERFRFSPYVSEPILLDLGVNGSFLEWNVWYNFRSKTEFTGKYYISIDDEIVENNTIVFPRLWKPTTISLNVTNYIIGDHEFSLAVADESNHFSNDTEVYKSFSNISVTIFNESGFDIKQLITYPVIAVFLMLIIRKRRL
ncbi:MAG: hypothetical protein GOP50_05585 [Candidatus Heimdallarchaeota archaeon]|nr:hypothetical protein [Candidatus Heimdallarchaeota archaeon]